MQSYWKDVAESFPGLANDARRELKWIDSLAQERLSSNTDLETLLTGLNPVEHYLRTFLTVEMKRVERDGVNLTKDDDRFEHSTDAFDAQKEQVEKDIFDRLFEEPKDNKADGRDDNARHTREARDR